MMFKKLSNSSPYRIDLLCYLTFIFLLSCTREIPQSDIEDIKTEELSVIEQESSSLEGSNIVPNEELIEGELDSSNPEKLTFKGYECTDDCSGHEAGYEWAEENSIDDANNCDGNSNSFNEGCESYVEENE